MNVGESVSFVIQVNHTEWDKTPARGLLVVTLDNKAGPYQAIELSKGIMLN